MGVDHYENFPVASLLMPAALRPAVKAIYRFARTADDLADEGDASDQERLQALEALQKQLNQIEQGQASDWPDLAAVIRAHHLPIALLRDLLSAFAQDVTVKRYDNYATLMDYCRRSANPIGRLLLALYQRTEAALLQQSDAICSALQLINFWQDIAIDWKKARVYLPQSELARYQVTEEHIAQQRCDERWQSLIFAQTAHARAMLSSGAPLPQALPGRVGWELRLVIQGGLRIAEKIDAAKGDVFRHRPVLTASDWALMSLRALRMTRP